MTTENRFKVVHDHCNRLYHRLLLNSCEGINGHVISTLK